MTTFFFQGAKHQKSLLLAIVFVNGCFVALRVEEKPLTIS